PPSSAYYPHNNIIDAISRGNERRPATAIGSFSAPTGGNGGRASGRDAESSEGAPGGAESHEGALVGSIRGGALEEPVPGRDVGLRHRHSNPSQVIAIKQIAVGILA